MVQSALLKVSGKLVADLKSLYQDTKDDERISHMGEMVEIGLLETEEQQMTLFAAKVRALNYPKEIPPLLNEFDGLADKLAAAAKAALRLQGSLQDIKQDRTNKWNLKKTSWQRDREAICSKLRNTQQVPAAIAKRMADLLQGEVKDPSAIGLQVGTACVSWPLKGLVSKTTFEEPAHIPEFSQTDSDADEMPRRLAMWAQTHKAEIEAIMTSNKTNLKQVGNNIIVDVISTQLLEWGLGPDDAIFTELEMPTALHTLKCMASDVRPCAFPFKLWRAIVQCLEGTCCVICVSSATVLANIDVDRWMKSSGSQALKDQPAFVLEQGESMLVPFGSYPIFMGLTREKVEKKPLRGRPGVSARTSSAGCDVDTVSIAVHLCADVTSDIKYSGEVCNVLAAQYGMARSWVPEQIREKQCVVDYIDAMSKVVNRSTLIHKDGPVVA